MNKRIQSVIYMMLFPAMAFAQTYNTVQNWVAQKPITTESDIIATNQPTQAVVKSTQYMDGFGRTVQSVIKGVSPSQLDVVHLHQYDTWGREVQQYLPFVSGNDGLFKSNALSLQTSFNQSLYPAENSFYAKTDFENSPLNRPTKNYAPGSSWVGSNRNNGVLHLVNVDVENVRIWNIAAAFGSIPSSSGAYGTGQLYKTITTDENGLQAIEYTDKDGQLVLQKNQVSAAADNGNGSVHTGWSCTYYVYDNFGNVRFIIPPKLVALIDGVWGISQTDADELCYRFEFDDYNRPVIQKGPGTPSGDLGEVWTIYDKRGRIVMKQDGNLRYQHKWQYFQYDSQDRPLTTGLITDQTGHYNDRAYYQANALTQINYPNIAGFPSELLSQTYYDNYGWVAGSGSGLGASLDASNTSNTSLFYTASNTTAPYPQSISQSVLVRGMMTGTKTAILDGSGTQFLYTVSFFDNAGRILQTQGNNSSGAIDKSTTQYSWTGVPLRIYEQHSKAGTGSQTHNTLTKMAYDHAWRLLSITKNVSSTVNGNAVNSGDKIISTYTYKEGGQLATKALGNALESLGFDYNVRGWLTGINKNYTQAGSSGHWFGEEIGYNLAATAAGSTTFTNPAFNGSISGQVWRSRSDGVARKYDFNYDNLNQLTAANFVQNTGGSTWDKTYMDFSVNSLSYDLNGNLKTLNQNGFVLGGAPNIDNLSYNYSNNSNSNKLQNVIDNSNIATSKLGDFHYSTAKTISTVDYAYDYNGNLTSDLNKSISSITYNSLNLPNVITFTKGTVTFLYDASGHKLKKTVQENNVVVPLGTMNYTTNITTTTTYIGGFCYRSKIFTNASLAPLNESEALSFAVHDEGRMRLAALSNGGLGWVFDYFIRDHLGNVRTTLTDEVQKDTYRAATLEPGGVGNEINYYNISNDASHIIPVSSLAWWPGVAGNGYQNNNGIPAPPDPTTNPTGTSANLYKLNGNTGDRFGLGIALKVMAGDVISIYGKSVWHDGGQTTNNSNYQISNVLNSFLTAFAGTNAVIGGSKGLATASALAANPNTVTPLSSILNNVGTPAGQTPKAYINWILFDEQFKPVAGGSGADPIQSLANTIKSHSISGININTSGYLYIYCSDESNQDVYFDNLQVVHDRGPLLEERHYYPDGLGMFALSSRAFGKLQTNFGYQGKDLQSGEFYDGSGLEEYDFEARYYDPQLGRWWSQDPANQFASPYTAMGNNWANGIDPSGKWAGWDDVIVSAIGFITGYVTSGITTGNWGWKSVKAGLISAVMFEVGYYTAGAGSAGLSQGGIANVFSAGGFQAQANTVGLSYAASASLSSAIGAVFPGFSVPIGNNFSIGVSPGFGISGGTLTAGANISATYDDGKFRISGGISSSGNATSYGGSLTYKGFGASYAINHFTGNHTQTSAQIGVYAGGASLRVDEDYIGDGKDRWRTGGLEIGFNDISVGLSVYTNDGMVESDNKASNNTPSPLWGPNKTGKNAWDNGQVFFSPAYVGFRHGNQISRVGFSHKEVQDFFQNGLHQSLFPTPYYLNYDNFSKGIYSYFGYYNPFTLY